MADPISSLNSYPSNTSVDDHGESSTPVAPLQSSVVPEPSRQCWSEAGNAAETPSASSSLVQKFSSPAVLTSATPSSSASGGTPAPPASRFLVTSSGAVPGGGSDRVAASLMKNEIRGGLLDGSRGELGTVSVQYGKDDDVQLVGARGTLVVSHAGYGVSLTGEAGVVRANLGENNDDGSLGGNIGSGAELLGGEVTLDTPAGSITGGLSVSASLSGSMGVRDADHDGEPEFCAKFSVPAYTLGACIERFW